MLYLDVASVFCPIRRLDLGAVEVYILHRNAGAICRAVLFQKRLKNSLKWKIKLLFFYKHTCFST